jgi:hypothetical protein
MKLRLPILPFVLDLGKPEKHDHVLISMAYDKRMKGPILYVQTGWFKDNCEGFIIFGSPRTTVNVESGWANNNKKKMTNVEASIEAQFENKSGPIYDQVAAFLVSIKSGFAVEPDSTAAEYAEEVAAGQHSGFDS